MINEFPNDTVPSENVITSLDAVETIFTATAKLCLKLKTTTKDDVMKYLSTKNGLIKKCLKRHELRKLANKKRRDPLNIRLKIRRIPYGLKTA